MAQAHRLEADGGIFVRGLLIGVKERQVEFDKRGGAPGEKEMALRYSVHVQAGSEAVPVDFRDRTAALLAASVPGGNAYIGSTVELRVRIRAANGRLFYDGDADGGAGTWLDLPAAPAGVSGGYPETA